MLRPRENGESVYLWHPVLLVDTGDLQKAVSFPQNCTSMAQDSEKLKGRSRGSWRLCLGRWASFSDSVNPEVISKGDTSCLWEAIAAVPPPQKSCGPSHPEPHRERTSEELCVTHKHPSWSEKRAVLTFPPAPLWVLPRPITVDLAWPYSPGSPPVPHS